MRAERLGEELESSDGGNVDNTVIVKSLIATVAQTVCQAWETVRGQVSCQRLKLYIVS
jgi:hypothetical protein